jgi:molybdopterin synthase sulfur carrier subunit
VRIRIPTPLRSYTAQSAYAEADGATVGELLADLERRHPGIRFRMVDEQEQLRKHMKIFLNDESVRDLTTPVGPTDEVTIMQALSGG